MKGNKGLQTDESSGWTTIDLWVHSCVGGLQTDESSGWTTISRLEDWRHCRLQTDESLGWTTIATPTIAIGKHAAAFPICSNCYTSLG